MLYGLHFSPGVAEYQEQGKDAYRILINEDVAKQMDPTFAGKPLYVEHVDEVDLARIQEEADGYILESFFNKLDGHHWAKMILVSDSAQDAYRKGYKLSNAYVPQSLGDGGQWHGVAYQKEVRSGEYEHMALVRDPRYAESIILTPDEFKKYNEEREITLRKLSNNKEENTMKFSFFRRTKVENAKDVDLENLEVELPKSNKVVTVATCVEGYDKVLNMSGYAANEHMVKFNDKEECTVSELVERHNNLEKELTVMKEKNAAGDEDEGMMNDGVGVEEGDEDLGVEAGADKTKKKNAKEDVVEEKLTDDVDAGTEISDEKADSKKKNSRRDPRHFDSLKNAEKRAQAEEAPTILLSSDKVALGRSRYGS